MNRNRFWMLGAFILVSAALVGATMKARQNALFRLARYEKSPAFTDYVSHLLTQTQTPSGLVRAANPLIEMAYPMSRDYEQMLSCRMSAQGTYGWGKLHPARASRAYSAQQKLTPVQLSKIRQLVNALPPSVVPADRYDVLGVVHYDSNPPQVRVYDRRNPPTQITEICRIIKMPLDSTR